MGDNFSDFEDDVFDGVDEAQLLELEKPSTAKRQADDASQSSKRQKTAHPTSPSSRSQNPDHLALVERLLSEKFGYSSFRHEQEGAIKSILAGKNTLVVFPTGAGKSLCYQIPAIAFPLLDEAEGTRDAANGGVTIVVSPLIALMKDQVDALQKRGIAADSIDSTKSWDELQLIYTRLRRSELRILYCAPERLNNEGFLETVKGIPGGIRLLAVDEAHCISEWGHSFRPDYLKVARFVDEIKAERVICLTATATPKVAEDVCKAFSISPSCVFQTSPYRPNLQLYAKNIEVPPASVIKVFLGETEKSEDDVRFEEMFRFLRSHSGPTLVYVALQQQAETHAKILKKKGFNAAAFHAGMKTEDKQRIQDDFMASRIQIVCATIAFGMGIDKANIRNIIHWDLSNSIEEYSQQIGRAGRDGLTSHCMFYLAPNAFYMREVFARGDTPSRQSLASLISDIFVQGAGQPAGSVIQVSHYKQTNDFDIRQNPLGIIYATLELHFGLIRAITPEYSAYKFEATKTYFPTLKNDSSPEGKAVFSSATKKIKWFTIDVNDAARSAGGGLKRNDIVRKLNQLNERGHIKLQTSGIEHRYLILKELPQTKDEISSVVDKLYADLQNREKDALARSSEVMALITGRKCFARALAEHFGMGLPGGKESCGHCTFCMTRTPLKTPVRPRYAATAATIQEVLKATDLRDDPRFLARVAFGIRSPRVTKLKLEKSPAFRSLAHYDFEVCACACSVG
ncbi:P-loop containing nucleoside triphosphate hydrolase protein [Podospora appendiculata]|uniref:DNA 3'-5' helicase n=1 Tax=Podospora appendiculata TaxID=314037 RepID=A0AAE1C8N3_9PEZI|nr:P-loop containing nucleoside triphosphate hydrolase protein [Podospora appendiculata]